jgi:hypothetical protein
VAADASSCRAYPSKSVDACTAQPATDERQREDCRTNSLQPATVRAGMPVGTGQQSSSHNNAPARARCGVRMRYTERVVARNGTPGRFPCSRAPTCRVNAPAVACGRARAAGPEPERGRRLVHHFLLPPPGLAVGLGLGAVCPRAPAHAFEPLSVSRPSPRVPKHSLNPTLQSFFGTRKKPAPGRGEAQLKVMGAAAPLRKTKLNCYTL